MKLTEKQLKTIIKESVKRTMIEEGFFGDMKDKFQQKFKMGDYKEVEGLEERLEEYKELRHKVNSLIYGYGKKTLTLVSFNYFITYSLRPSERRGVKIQLDNLLNNLYKLDNEQYNKAQKNIKAILPYLKSILVFNEKITKNYADKLNSLKFDVDFKHMEHKNSKKVRGILEQNFNELNSILNDVEKYLTTAKKVFESIKRLKSLDSFLKNLPKYQQALENSI